MKIVLLIMALVFMVSCTTNDFEGELVIKSIEKIDDNGGYKIKFVPKMNSSFSSNACLYTKRLYQVGDTLR